MERRSTYWGVLLVLLVTASAAAACGRRSGGGGGGGGGGDPEALCAEMCDYYYVECGGGFDPADIDRCNDFCLGQDAVLADTGCRDERREALACEAGLTTCDPPTGICADPYDRYEACLDDFCATAPPAHEACD